MQLGFFSFLPELLVPISFLIVQQMLLMISLLLLTLSLTTSSLLFVSGTGTEIFYTDSMAHQSPIL
jgi:hypothetical protein